jgi:hypothetical protein
MDLPPTAESLRKGTPDLHIIDIVPPRETWDQASKLREKYVSYMPYDSPHISFIDPFLLEQDFMAAKMILEERLKDFPPLKISFPQVCFFPKKKKGRCSTVYAEPVMDPPDGLQNLYVMVMNTFPQLKKNSHPKPVLPNPHLTLAQFEDDAELNEKFPIIQKEWIPFSFQVTEIHFLARAAKREPFEIRTTVPVGAQIVVPINEIPPIHTCSPLSRTLILIRIPKTTQQQQLCQIFADGFEKCTILPNPPERHDWCCAAITFLTREGMVKALEQYPTSESVIVNTDLKPLEILMMYVDLRFP